MYLLNRLFSLSPDEWEHSEQATFLFWRLTPMRKMIGKCPACDQTQFEVARLRCTNCGTAVEGQFALTKLGGLASEHQEFIELFVKCRGEMEEVERELGLSPLSARGRLDRALVALEYQSSSPRSRRREILDSLERKEISPEEAVSELKQLS